MTLRLIACTGEGILNDVFRIIRKTATIMELKF